MISEFFQWASDVGTAIAAAFTAFGAWAAVRQLRLLEKQSVTTFEDELVREYRAIIKEMPVAALLGEDLKEDLFRASLMSFYRYFDLCNQEAFLKSQGRISDKTWALWEEGIKGNMNRPAFNRAWAEISSQAKGDFDELRKILSPRLYVSDKGAA